MHAQGQVSLAAGGQWSPELQKARVYEQLLLDIVLGELPPGARLDEQALTRRYGSGLAGVRDALGRLALEGMVVRRARAGTTVSPLDLVDLREGYEARALIEPHCAAMAARNATLAEIAQIGSAFDDAERAIRDEDHRALVAMDHRFHGLIAQASRNAALARILIPLQHKAARFWVFSMGTATEEERLTDICQHRAIARAIAARDVEGARSAMMLVLGAMPQTVQRTLSGRPEEDARVERVSG
ncbi:GntR family transcriptional regulator [Phenylobacterium sp.]|uniref:GntR family transcriptional regulator n=1 Tax=Phenylobacterium sp. TaxID=1871053 RepID=UPI002FDAFB49